VKELTVTSAAVSVVFWCSVPSATVTLVDHRTDGQTRRYAERFDEAFFDIDGSGNVDIVLRRSRPARSDIKRNIEQVVHIHSVWRSIPGATVAQETQINGTVSYVIRDGRNGATYEGGGSVFFETDVKRLSLTGQVDQALLHLVRKLGEPEPLFSCVDLSGMFRAARDPRQVARLLNEINRTFGPLPPPAPVVAAGP
jgi:hypothetical protein